MTALTHAEGVAEFLKAYDRTGVLLHVECWQIIFRNNDTNGNPLSPSAGIPRGRRDRWL
jgi:hypothetical protein